MNLSRCVLALVVSCAAVVEAAPSCKERVASLKALSARLGADLGSWNRGPIEMIFGRDVSLENTAEERPEWKTRGLRLVAKLDDAFEKAFDRGLASRVASDLLLLAPQGKVEVCVELNGPVELKQSLDADSKLLEPLVAELSRVDAADRATVVAKRAMEFKWKCEGIPDTFEGVRYVAPADRLALITKFIAEGLEKCGCPEAEAERIYVHLALMTDTWTPRFACARVIIGTPPAAKPVEFEGPVINLVKALEAAGTAGVVLADAQPPPAPAPKKKK